MSDEIAKRHEAMLADALWKTVFYYWQNPDDRSDTVMLPPFQTANALVKCLGHVVAQIEDPAARRKIIQSVGPVLDKHTNTVRGRAEATGLIELPKDDVPRILQ